jgi:hypothetical protein
MPDCSVCMQEMDMEEFQDPRESTPTCVKLECNHAYHTRCAITYLKRSNFDCILCNRHKEPRERLEEEQLALNTFAVVKRDPAYRELKKEALVKFKTYTDAKKAAKKEVNDFLASRNWFGLKEVRVAAQRASSRTRAYLCRTAIRRVPLLRAVLTGHLQRGNRFHLNHVFGLPHAWKFQKGFYIHGF